LNGDVAVLCDDDGGGKVVGKRRGVLGWMDASGQKARHPPSVTFFVHTHPPCPLRS
jgi:hypothetical protein